MSCGAIDSKKLAELAEKKKPEIPNNFLYIKGKYDRKTGAKIEEVISK